MKYQFQSKWRSIIATVVLFAVASLGLVAQNLKDDIAHNDLEGLKSKVALLEPDFKDAPYLADYLATCTEFAPEMLDYLIAQKADVNQKDAAGRTPLSYAIDKGYRYAINTLLANKADPNLSGVNDLTPLEWAIGCEDIETIRKLLEKKAAVNTFAFATDESGYRASIGPSLFIRYFDKKKYEFPYYKNDERLCLSPLVIAINCKNPEILELLLESGADPLTPAYQIKDSKASTGKKEIYRTVNTVFDYITARFATAQTLEDIGPAFFVIGCKLWQTVLALPKNKQPEIDKVLLDNIFAYFATGNLKAFKAALVKTGANTLNFLPYAALAGNWDIVDTILKYNQIGIDDAFDESSESLLAWAINNQHTVAAKMLIDHGALLPSGIKNRGGSEAQPPLVLAVSNGRYDLSKLLLEHGADVNAGKPTPLLAAIQHGRADLVQLLLAAKADPSATELLDSCHKSPEIRKMLLDAGAKGQESLVMGAVKAGSLESLNFWLGQGLDPQGDIGNSTEPLVAAVARKDVEMVKLLLAKGAYPGVQMTRAHFDSYQIYDRSKIKTLFDFATQLVTDARDPLQKNRANQIAKLIDQSVKSLPPGEFKVGAPGPAGGIVFFDKGYTKDGWRYLEAAPADFREGIQWYNGSNIDIATAEEIGTGKVNTQAILAAQGPGQYAAALCDAYTLNGFDDWFLPSKDELNEIYEKLKKSNMGDLSGGYYWSSSQNGNGSAWYRGFDDGYQSYTGTHGKCRVRPVRAF